MDDQTSQPLGVTEVPILGRLFRRGHGLNRESLAYPVIETVQCHWDALRAGRMAPARSEIDPRPLASALPNLFVAELIAPGVARLRLCGQHLSDLLGMEPRGMPLSVFIEPEARNEMAEAVTQVSKGARVNLPLRAESGFAQPILDGQMALMPLTDAAGQITRILGVVETHGPIGRAPRRFRLGSPILPMTDTPPRPVGRPVLRVIKGGRD